MNMAWSPKLHEFLRITGKFPLFLPIVTGIDSYKASKASLLADDKARVFNGLSKVIGIDTRYTVTCSTLTDG
jgi:hypothetical protein